MVQDQVENDAHAFLMDLIDQLIYICHLTILWSDFQEMTDVVTPIPLWAGEEW